MCKCAFDAKELQLWHTGGQNYVISVTVLWPRDRSQRLFGNERKRKFINGKNYQLMEYISTKAQFK